MKHNAHALAQNVAIDENTKIITEATTLTPKDKLVVAQITAAATITLPDVTEMAGETIIISLDSATNDILTIQDNDESVGWSDITMSSTGGYVVLYSTGRSWVVLASTAASAKVGMFESFQSHPVSANKTGAAATGTTGTENVMALGGNILEYHILGTQTILTPQQAAGGLNVGMDQTDNDGVEICPGILAGGPCVFTVGAGAFFARLKFSIADVSGTDDCAFGFRKMEAYQANIDDYDEMAVLNVISGDIKIETILNGAGTTTTDTTNNWADGETHTLEVRVSNAGVVTYLLDDVAPTTVAAFTFDTGEVVVPFFYMLQANAAQTGVVLLQEFECNYL